MSEPFIATIMIWPANFAPRGWAFCQGQILNINQNVALFSLLGTTYGGNGQSTFGLPDLRGRAPIGQGQGTGLPLYQLGEMAGTPATTLTSAQMPIHNHTATFVGTQSLQADVTLNATATAATKDAPADGLQLGDAAPNSTKIYAPAGGTQIKLGGTSAQITGTVGGTVTVGTAGGSQPIDTISPYLCVNYIIALDGIFPSRN